MTAPRVAVTLEGVRGVHAGDGSGNYATLCGLDGEENTVERAGNFEKITCPQCAEAWKAWKVYRPADFCLAIRLKHDI